MLLYIGTSLLYLCFSNVHSIYMNCIFTSQGVRDADLHSGLWSVHIEKNKKRNYTIYTAHEQKQDHKS